MMISLGVIVGVFIYLTKLDQDHKGYELDEDTFFYFLIPPLVLEAGYFIPNRYKLLK